jgi:hypothetical protein
VKVAGLQSTKEGTPFFDLPKSGGGGDVDVWGGGGGGVSFEGGGGSALRSGVCLKKRRRDVGGRSEHYEEVIL